MAHGQLINRHDFMFNRWRDKLLICPFEVIYLGEPTCLVNVSQVVVYVLRQLSYLRIEGKCRYYTKTVTEGQLLLVGFLQSLRSFSVWRWGSETETPRPWLPEHHLEVQNSAWSNLVITCSEAGLWTGQHHSLPTFCSLHWACVHSYTSSNCDEWSISQSIDQSINQSIDRSTNRSISQSINQSINQSIDRSTN